MVDRVVNRLSRRRQRKNQNLKKREIINQLGKLFIDNGSI